MTHKIEAETRLRLTMDGEVLDTTWASFAADNDLDDSPEWRDEILAELQDHCTYHGGGGAQPWYRLAVIR